VPGLQRHQIGLRTQHFRISTFSRLHCDQTVRPRGPMFALFCITEGPAVNAFTGFKRPLQYCPEGRGPTPENFSPQFPQISGVGQFFAFIIRGPQGPSGKNFGNCTAHFLGTKFRNLRKIDCFRLLEIAACKNVDKGPQGSPYNWARVHPRITKSDRSLVGWLE